MAKASKGKDQEPKLSPAAPQEGPAETVATEAPKPRKLSDGFDEGNKNKNIIFEEWRGEITAEEKGRGDKKKIKRFYTPLVKLHSRRKITQKEADFINFGAANTERFSFVIMYLPVGTTQGERQNVNDILDGAWDETGGAGDDE